MVNPYHRFSGPDWFERRDRVPGDYADYSGKYGNKYNKGLDNPYRARLEAMYGPVDEMETARIWNEWSENGQQFTHE